MKPRANSFFVVQVNAVPGEDAELNRWYDEQHFDDCLRCDSAVAAQRFQKVPETGPGNYTYLALYEVGDPQKFAESRKTKEGTPLLPRTDALALPAHAFFYRPLPDQPGLLMRQERRSFYIEFLEFGSAENSADLLKDRQRILELDPMLGLCELMKVDRYQERQGWHADAIIFAELANNATESWQPPAPVASVTTLKVVEAGLYRPASPRKVRP